MMLTTSDVHTMVTQGIRARFGRLVDPEAVFNTWLEAHDQAVINAAHAFDSLARDCGISQAEVATSLAALGEQLAEMEANPLATLMEPPAENHPHEGRV
ncbi:hypothetical protein SAMN05216184_104118 [Georgenia satyanarayanai]|uniref:Uncharacterized protein n=1 Tax=Georgenia satyanarayanai TaxID=860221 RepID=A0A2Y9A7S7_9MICO|nr:hypothetical protein [Georgenia satyanarayanai]PYG00179.1 hypothetical protein A8987_104118 [Georgenia satyanarayanai]SSA40410.1 hypothetical protein SAMN05216184_104118 [Georgenia satyanarayanai]